MQILKRHIFALIMLTTLVCSNTMMAQAKVWLDGGLNFSKMRKVYANESFGQEDDFRPGFNVGLSLQQQLRNKVDIVSSIVYDSKGYVTKMDDANNTTLYFKTHYLDFYPSSLQYYYSLSTQSKVYGITGPYFGIGLYGKEESRDDNGTYEEDIDWGKLELERFDIGWNIGFGYEFKQMLQCELGYDMGLKNITDNTNKYLKLRNHTLKVTVKISLSHIFSLIINDDEHFREDTGLSD